MGCGRYEAEEYYGFYDALNKNGEKLETLKRKLSCISYNSPEFQSFLKSVGLLDEYKNYKEERDKIFTLGKEAFPHL